MHGSKLLFKYTFKLNILLIFQYIFAKNMKKGILILFITLAALQISFAGSEDNRLFTLYPVPLSSSTLTVSATSIYTNITSVELRNLVGKKLQEKTMVGGKNVVFQDMDIYPNGLYVIIAKDVNGKILETSKFIINK